MESTTKDQEYEGPLSYLRVTRKFSLGTPTPPLSVHGAQRRLHAKLQKAN